MGIPYTRTASSLTLVVDFRPTVIPSSHPNFAQLSELAKSPKTTEADIKPLLDIPAAITSFTGGAISIVNGRLFYNGSEVKTNLAQIILGFVKSGDPAAAVPFQKFLLNCRQNPDLALVDTIYDWAVKGNLPITPDGELIAWKIVGKDYMSLTSGKRGKLRHQIGDVVTEPREECDADRNRTCSTGIHFCSIEYLQKGGYGGGLTGGNRVMAVVINPADVTAIPTDYNLTKGRCCRLRVVGEVEGIKAPDYYGSSKVYDWSSKASTRGVDLPVRPGDVVKLRDGRTGTVTQGSGRNKIAGINGNTGQFYVETGMARSSGTACKDDVVETISRAPATPRNKSGIAVGQVWARRNGTEVTIDVIDGSGGYPVHAGTDVYTASGRYNSESSVSQFDLVRLVKDVA